VNDQGDSIEIQQSVERRITALHRQKGYHILITFALGD
jgi:hypothetical protein